MMNHKGLKDHEGREEKVESTVSKPALKGPAPRAAREEKGREEKVDAEKEAAS
jgi:hypothetical protein